MKTTKAWEVTTETDVPGELGRHQVAAQGLRVEGGALAFLVAGEVVQAWGPGHWVHVRLVSS